MDRTINFYIQNPNVIDFPKLGLSFEVDPTAFTIFGIEIKWYGILIAIGMILAMIYCFRRMRSFGIDSDRAIDAVIFGLIGAIVGARTYYILFSSSTGFDEFFSFRNGGLAIYGGLIGAILVGGIVAKIRKVRLLPLLDIASIGFLIGQAVGRWGNFINMEAFGSATNLPWGMSCYNVQNDIGYLSDTVVMAHPCFLYESIWCVIGFFVLHFLSKKRKYDGQVFLMYTIWYGFGRFFIEGLRTDSLMLGNMRVSQLLAALLVTTSVIVMIIVQNKIRLNGDFVLYKDTEQSKNLLAEADRKTAEKKSKKADKAEKEAVKAEKNAEKAVKESEKASVKAEKAAKEAEKAEKKIVTEDKTEEE